MVEVAALPKCPPVALGVINLHGQVIAVLDVRRRLGLRPRSYGLSARLVVARTVRRTVALVVDEVPGVTEISVGAVRAPDSVLPGIGHVAGIAALPDGVLIIQDLDRFLSLDEEQALTTAMEDLSRP